MFRPGASRSARGGSLECDMWGASAAESPFTQPAIEALDFGRAYRQQGMKTKKSRDPTFAEALRRWRTGHPASNGSASDKRFCPPEA